MTLQKHLTYTVIFYVATAVLVTILEKLAPSNMCNPGLGMLLFFVSVPVVFVLIINSIRLALVRSADFIWLLALHLALIGLSFAVLSTT